MTFVLNNLKEILDLLAEPGWCFMNYKLFILLVYKTSCLY